VECKACGLIYSNPIFPSSTIIRSYVENVYVEKDVQLANMAEDYLTELKRLEPLLPRKEDLLEIGCANGFFLRRAKEVGFKRVWGVEVGKQAVSKAPPDVRDSIINDVFSKKLFKKESFDVVCLLQILDHALDPRSFLEDVRYVLRKGGFILAVNHNVRSLLTRILGENSPMFDIAHIYLFDKTRMRELLERCGFEVIYVRSLWNRYSFEHCLKMFPLPGSFKSPLTDLSRRLGLAEKTLKVMAGNMVSVARKV
jgi:SAM-dependent methyltransferase